jgi:hypothetical protein
MCLKLSCFLFRIKNFKLYFHILSVHTQILLLSDLYPFIALWPLFGPSKRGPRKQRGFQKRLSRLGFQIAQTEHKCLVNKTKKLV